MLIAAVKLAFPLAYRIWKGKISCILMQPSKYSLTVKERAFDLNSG